MKFKVGQKVVFKIATKRDEYEFRFIATAMSFPYLTISSIDEVKGLYCVIETEGPWNGMYWEPYEEPITFDEELFIL